MTCWKLNYNYASETVCSYRLAVAGHCTAEPTSETRLSSNLRQTTRECVYLGSSGHFQSHHKNGGHTIRSAIADDPVLHANVMAIPSIEPDLLPIKVLHCGWGSFVLFCSCALDLDLMTLTYDPDRILRRCTTGPKMNFLCQCFQKLSHYRHIDTHTDKCHWTHYHVNLRPQKQHKFYTDWFKVYPHITATFHQLCPTAVVNPGRTIQIWHKPGEKRLGILTPFL